MEIVRQSDGVVQVSGHLHISDAESLRSALIEELKAVPSLVLDLSQVESGDTASFQLLCSARKSAETNGKGFRISTPSPAMRETSAILGVSLENLTVGVDGKQEKV
jgi:anti-anti-sigma factor